MVHNLRLKQAEVHLTYRCNLSCPACNRGCFYKKSRIPDMTMGTFLKLMDDIDRLGFLRRLAILGGEPTLHPQFIEFLELGKSRGFEQQVFSNGYTEKSRRLLEYVKKSHLAAVQWWSMKPLGSDELPLGKPLVFCAPRDLSGSVLHTCDWRENPNCGYSVDELGYAPCPPGGMIAHWQCPQVKTVDLANLLDEDWKSMAFGSLCQFCGAYTSVDTMGISKRYNTLMTESWLKVFDE